jgi:hypothetical protein
MRKLLALTLVVGSMAMMGTSTASAHWKFTPSQIAKVKKPQGKIWAYEMNIKHARWTLWYTRHHPQFYTYKAWKNTVRDHLWLVKYSREKIAEIRASMLPPHNKLWECIHNGEGSWGDTGDPYWGGLQMHPGWGGVHHASDLSPFAQKWLAEHELEKIRYDQRYAWVSGQWPISHKACMQYL